MDDETDDGSGPGGVLPDELILRGIEEGIIDAGSFTIPTKNIQPASLDLRLAEEAYRIRCSFLPGNELVERKVKDYVVDEIDLHGDGALLETNRPYLIRLKERISLPPAMRAKTNPKSSTGRCDVFTRVITDRGRRFDEIEQGYDGPLWLEVVPLSFPIRVREDLTLNQLRLSTGHVALDDDDISPALHEQSPVLFVEGRPVDTADLPLQNGLFLSLDLRGGSSGHVGYSARPSAPQLDLTGGEPLDPRLYWDQVFREEGDRLILTPARFYLLMSNEAVSIPPSVAAEMTAYDPTSGELRTHYAGFFDPGFGFDPSRQFRGSRAALEVRAHDVPFMIEHGQQVCKLTFERMQRPPLVLYGAQLGSSYQRQEETLSRYFLRST